MYMVYFVGGESELRSYSFVVHGCSYNKDDQKAAVQVVE